MNELERDARLVVLNRIHGVAAWLLTFDCVNTDATDWFGSAVRRWAQASKLELVDGLDARGYEVWSAGQRAIDRHFHPDRALKERGFVLPGLVVAK